MRKLFQNGCQPTKERETRVEDSLEEALTLVLEALCLAELGVKFSSDLFKELVEASRVARGYGPHATMRVHGHCVVCPDRAVGVSEKTVAGLSTMRAASSRQRETGRQRVPNGTQEVRMWQWLDRLRLDHQALSREFAQSCAVEGD